MELCPKDGGTPTSSMLFLGNFPSKAPGIWGRGTLKSQEIIDLLEAGEAVKPRASWGLHLGWKKSAPKWRLNPSNKPGKIEFYQHIN